MDTENIKAEHNSIISILDKFNEMENIPDGFLFKDILKIMKVLEAYSGSLLPMTKGDIDEKI